MISLRHLSFAVLWLLIIAVSVHDGYWVLANRSWIHLAERNPVGRFLLHANGGDVWLLVAVKSVGTACAATLLLLVYWAWPRAGWLACAATAAFQLGLLWYLYSV